MLCWPVPVTDQGVAYFLVELASHLNGYGQPDQPLGCFDFVAVSPVPFGELHVVV